MTRRAAATGPARPDLAEREAKPRAWSVADPDRAELTGVFVHPLARDAKAPCHLRRIEPLLRRGRRRKESLVLHHFDDALGEGIQESSSDRVDQRRVEFEVFCRVVRSHAGSFEEGVGTSQPHLGDASWTASRPQWTGGRP